MKCLSFIVLAILVCMGVAHAADAPVIAVSVLPSFVDQLLSFLVTIPKVGPILQTVLIYVGSVAALFTALTLFVKSVLAIPVVITRFAGAKELSDKIDSFSKKIEYYLDILSIFNAKQKK